VRMKTNKTKKRINKNFTTKYNNYHSFVK